MLFAGTGPDGKVLMNTNTWEAMHGDSTQQVLFLGLMSNFTQASFSVEYRTPLFKIIKLAINFFSIKDYLVNSLQNSPNFPNAIF